MTLHERLTEANRGPYINDDGDIWLPVDAWGWNDARREAAGYAVEAGGDVARYLGKVVVPLWEEDTDDAVERLAYHFEVVEKP